MIGVGGRLRSVLAVLAAVAACGGPDEPPDVSEQAVPVSAWTIQSREVTVERRWTGRIEPLRVLAVRAPAAGRVATVDVRDGDDVSQGQALVRLEGPDVEARRQVLAERRAQLEEELTRWRGLAQEGAAGPGEVAAAELRLLEVREQAEQIEALVESYVVRSPAAGRALRPVVSPGANVAAGEALLEVEDASSRGIRLSIGSAEAGLFQGPTVPSVRHPSGRELQVERAVVSSDVHPAFVQVDLYLEAGEGNGHGVGEVFHRRSSADVLLVPWTAVASDGDRHWVALVVPGDPARIERRTVELGGAHSDGIEVIAGLEVGDRVVRYDPRSHPEGRAVVALSASGALP